MTFITFIATKGEIAYLPYEMSIYRKHGANYSSSNTQIGKIGLKNQIERMKFIDLFLDYKYSEKINKVIKYYKKELFYFSILGKIQTALRLRTRLKYIVQFLK